MYTKKEKEVAKLFLVTGLGGLYMNVGSSQDGVFGSIMFLIWCLVWIFWGYEILKWIVK